jgi:hypothetical protein
LGRFAGSAANLQQNYPQRLQEKIGIPAAAQLQGINNSRRFWRN